MTHNHPPQDPTETKASTDLEPSTTHTPKKNSNMRSRWKKSSHGQSKTPSASSPSFGIVEQPLVSSNPESQTTKPETAEKPALERVKAAEDAPTAQDPVAKTSEEPLEKAPSRRPRAREDGSEAPRRFPRSSESTQHRPHSGRPSFNRPPIRKEQRPKDPTKNNMDYEPSRASTQKKQSLEDAILKTQEPSLWNKIKQFFAGLFSEPKPKTEAKPRGPRPMPPRNARRYPRNRNSYYGRNNSSRGRKES